MGDSWAKRHAALRRLAVTVAGVGVCSATTQCGTDWVAYDLPPTGGSTSTGGNATGGNAAGGNATGGSAASSVGGLGTGGAVYSAYGAYADTVTYYVTYYY